MNLLQSLLHFASNKKQSLKTVLIGILLLSNMSVDVLAQPETMAWGNIIGYRIKGELIKFETSLQIAKKDWGDFVSTEKEKQRPHFSRDGKSVTITSQLENISMKEIVTELESGNFKINFELTADSSTQMEGAFFSMELPNHQYAESKIELVNAKEIRSYDMPSDWSQISQWMEDRYKPVKASGVKISTPTSTIEINPSVETDIILLKGNPNWGNPNTRILFAIILGDAVQGEKATSNIQ